MIKYDLMVANGSYQKEGEPKTSWLKVGRVMATKKGGFVMKLDCLPTSVNDKDGNSVAWDGWLQMFEPRAKTEQSEPAKDYVSPTHDSSQPQPADDGFDDIPF